MLLHIFRDQETGEVVAVDVTEDYLAYYDTPFYNNNLSEKSSTSPRKTIYVDSYEIGDSLYSGFMFDVDKK